MKKKTNFAISLLIISILLIIFGCGSKKKVIDQKVTKQIEVVADTKEKTKEQVTTTKKDVTVKSSNVKIEYIGESNNDSLSVTHLPNQLLIIGKGKLLINSFSNEDNSTSNEVKSEKDTDISTSIKSVLNEEIKVKEEVIKKNNGFNFYVIGIMVVIIAVLFLIHWIKNKFKLNG